MEIKKYTLTLNPEFVEKVGEDKVIAFNSHVERMAVEFEQAFLRASGTATQHARNYFSEVLQQPEFVEHRHEFMEAARLLIVDRFQCVLVTYIAELAVELEQRPSDLAYHLLDHLDQATKHRELRNRLGELINGVVPEELRAQLESLRQKRKEQPEGG